MNGSDWPPKSDAPRCQFLPTSAKGNVARDRRAFLYHLDIALGSQGEVEVQLEIAGRLGFIGQDDYTRVLDRVAEVGRMLNGLIESLQPDSR